MEAIPKTGLFWIVVGVVEVAFVASHVSYYENSVVFLGHCTFKWNVHRIWHTRGFIYDYEHVVSVEACEGFCLFLCGGFDTGGDCTSPPFAGCFFVEDFVRLDYKLICEEGLPCPLGELGPEDVVELTTSGCGAEDLRIRACG